MESSDLYCYVHPKRATSLRCNRCGRPICAQCVVRTPVGYRCKNCVRELLKVYDNARWYDFPVVFIATAIVAGIGVSIASYAGWFGLIVDFFTGLAAERVAQWASRYRRSRHLWLAAVAGALLSATVFALLPLVVSGEIFAVGQGAYLLQDLMSIGWGLLDAVIIVVVLIGRLRGRW
jgi:hypothetical protein